MIKATQKVKFAQSTWLLYLYLEISQSTCTWNFHNVLEYLYVHFSQSTCTCLHFQQKYLYLYLVKQNVLVLKYIADIIDPSLLVSDKIERLWAHGNRCIYESTW